MKTLVLLITSALLGCSCSTTQTRKLQIYSHPAFRPLIDEFYGYCKQYGGGCTEPIELYVKFKPIKTENVLGQCRAYYPPDEHLRIVEIQPELEDNPSLKNIVFHELFHCVLNKPHYDNEFDIMNSYERGDVTEAIYERWDFFVERVFKRQ